MRGGRAGHQTPEEDSGAMPGGVARKEGVMALHMETVTDLLTRRSVRAYKDKQVEEGALDIILRCGELAPSGMGRQPTKMVVLQDKDEIAELSRMNAQIMGADSDPFYGAPTVIVVLADPSSPTCVEDGSLVMGNLMNAAHAVGVDSCWIHRARQEFDSPEGKALLTRWGVEGTWIGVGHCVLGYADGPAPEAKPRKDGRVIRR